MKFYPSEKQFIKLSKKGNVIPVYTELSVDLETPVSAFLKLDKGDYSFLLESVEGEEKIARFSFLGSYPPFVLKSHNNKISAVNLKNSKIIRKKTSKTADPLDELKKIIKKFKFVRIKGLPRFCGGMVGFMGYDFIRFIEPRLKKGIESLKDDLNLPDMIFMLFDNLVIFDHAKGVIKIVNCTFIKNDPKTSYAKAIKQINETLCKLQKSPGETAGIKDTKKIPAISSNISQKQFKNAVLKAKKYIREGDVIQVVFSQRLKAKLNVAPFALYRSLRLINPSSYMFYLKLKDVILVGSSPELLVRCEDGKVETRPIAGTRPRGKTQNEDKRLEKELLNCKKERAEHLMLVDLGRNDLGRACRFGSVKLTEFMTIERYSHVMHIVSNIQGRLDKGKDAFDALRACFPAGTVCGAPKIRAMEIINELENRRRGPYAGCVGYFSFSGNMDTCITIRTMVIKNGNIYIQAGAGIVHDSMPAFEYRESINKAKALLEAIKRG